MDYPRDVQLRIQEAHERIDDSGRFRFLVLVNGSGCIVSTEFRKVDLGQGIPPSLQWVVREPHRSDLGRTYIPYCPEGRQSTVQKRLGLTQEHRDLPAEVVVLSTWFLRPSRSAYVVEIKPKGGSHD